MIAKIIKINTITEKNEKNEENIFKCFTVTTVLNLISKNSSLVPLRISFRLCHFFLFLVSPARQTIPRLIKIAKIN